MTPIPETSRTGQTETSPAAASRSHSPLQRSILLTVLYGDLFDYPLTEDELRRYLPTTTPTRAAFENALAGLLGSQLARADGFVTLADRQQLAGVRRRRARLAAPRWEQAARYAAWLRHVPFLRMVAVCGSQAVDNPRPDADIDFFLIADRGRLWTVQLCAMMLRRLASFRSVPVCPNYLLTVESLEVEPRDLYHAREAAQAVPLWGREAYDSFRRANRWIDDLLPNLEHADDRRTRLAEPRRSRPAGALEWLLSARLGDLVEAGIHRLLLWYYPWRLGRRAGDAEGVRRAYRHDRQLVVAGGYAPIVERAFRARAAALLGEEAAAAEIESLFPAALAPQAPEQPYADLFATRYGQTDD